MYYCPQIKIRNKSFECTIPTDVVNEHKFESHLIYMTRIIDGKLIIRLYFKNGKNIYGGEKRCQQTKKLIATSMILMRNF